MASLTLLLVLLLSGLFSCGHPRSVDGRAVNRDRGLFLPRHQRQADVLDPPSSVEERRRYRPAYPNIGLQSAPKSRSTPAIIKSTNSTTKSRENIAHENKRNPCLNKHDAFNNRRPVSGKMVSARRGLGPFKCLANNAKKICDKKKGCQTERSFKKI